MCDIGNSTYHFYDGKRDFKIYLDEDLPYLDNKIVYFISVNQKAQKKLKKVYKRAINLKKYISIDTKYKGLGIDRIIACMYLKNGIVIDAGSAITIDIIRNSKHKGGYILPGLQAYSAIYPQISNKLNFKLDIDIDITKIPLKTNDAINSAIILSIVSTIKQITKNKQIILTGGDSKILSRYFKKVIIKPNLIFENMNKIIYRVFNKKKKISL